MEWVNNLLSKKKKKIPILKLFIKVDHAKSLVFNVNA